MKKSILLILTVLLFACTPLGNDWTFGPKIKAKVIRITCASTVIQILDSSSYSLGVTWPVNGTSDTILNAAYVANKCEFSDNITAGNEFYFKQIPESHTRHDCMVCTLYDFPPSKGINLKVVN